MKQTRSPLRFVRNLRVITFLAALSWALVYIIPWAIIYPFILLVSRAK